MTDEESFEPPSEQDDVAAGEEGLTEEQKEETIRLFLLQSPPGELAQVANGAAYEVCVFYR